MTIRLKKNPDRSILTVVRDDGSAEVQRSTAAVGTFFALHDLLHYAVETTLGCTDAFYGLLARGWSFDTFGDRADPRYQSIPAQAMHIEHLVAILSVHILSPARNDPELCPLWAEDINREWLASLARAGLTHAPLGPPPLLAIAAAFESLSARWASTPAGDHLDLPWPATTR